MTFNTLSVRLSAQVQMCVFQSVPAIRLVLSVCECLLPPQQQNTRVLSLCVYESFDGFKCLKRLTFPYLSQITTITAGSRPRAWEGRTETPRAPGVSRKGRILSQTYTYTSDVFRFINVLPAKQHERREASFHFHLMGELKRLMLF